MKMESRSIWRDYLVKVDEEGKSQELKVKDFKDTFECIPL